MKRLHATLILICLAACVALMIGRDVWMYWRKQLRSPHEHIVHAIGVEHEITAHTYTLGSDGLKFIGSDGVTVAIFTSFDWMKLIPASA